MYGTLTNGSFRNLHMFYLENFPLVSFIWKLKFQLQVKAAS